MFPPNSKSASLYSSACTTYIIWIGGLKAMDGRSKGDFIFVCWGGRRRLVFFFYS